MIEVSVSGTMSREDERNLEGLLGVVGGGGTVLVRVGVAVEVRIVVRSAERRVVGGVTGGCTCVDCVAR